MRRLQNVTGWQLQVRWSLQILAKMSAIAARMAGVSLQKGAESEWTSYTGGENDVCHWDHRGTWTLAIFVERKDQPAHQRERQFPLTH